jgi:VanZ family protein
MMDAFDMLILRRIGFAATFLAIGVLSLLPERFLPHIDHSVSVILRSDNTHHMIAYTILTILGLMSYQGVKRRAIVIVTITALGATLESAQLLTSSRSAEFGEFLFNCMGVMVGVVVVWIWSLLWPRLVGIKDGSAD